ncbi:MAG: hypothetical protein ACNS60_01440 [Candidatus Cyclobacteriaceae bacterium M2_1C_046]
MKLLPNPNTAYLLNVSLESLHTESLEWLNEIEFLKDELAFFYKLIYIKEFKHDLPVDAVTNIENQLVYINNDKLKKLKKDLLYHEKVLAQLYKLNPAPEEENYRTKHKHLWNEMHQLSGLVKKMKKDLFLLIHSN